MSITIKAIVAVVLLTIAGFGAIYYFRIENRVKLELPSVDAPTDKSRQQLTQEYRQKAGSQDDLKPLDWAAKAKK